MKSEKITAIICVIIMFAIGFGTLISDNKEPELSNDENRMLQGMPSFTYETVFDGIFAQEFENYMIDRIPFRKQIIGLQGSIAQSLSVVTLEDTLNVIDTKITQQMEGLGEESEDIVVSPSPSPSPSDHKNAAEDTGTETPSFTETTAQISSEPTATPDPNKFNGSSTKYIGFVDQENGATTVLAAFNTSDIIDYAYTLNTLSLLLPEDGNLVQIISLESRKARPWLSAVSESKDVVVIDETVEILEYYTLDNSHIISGTLLFEDHIQNNDPVYFFTDPHWSVEGAYYAYDKAMSEIGLNSLKWEDYDVTYEYPFRGAYFKNAQTSYYIENPDTLAILFFPQASTFTHYLGGDNIEVLPIIQMDAVDNDRYRVYYDGPQFVGPLSVIETTSGMNRNALIILDSYGLSFSTMLIPHYDNICLMDLRYMYKSTEYYYISNIIEEYNISDIFIVTGDLNSYGTFYQKLISQFLNEK